MEIFYSVIVTTGAIHVDGVFHSSELLVLSLIIIVFAGFCAVSSVVLLVGLFLDHRMMLLPWIFSVTITTLINIISFFYLFNDVTIDPNQAVFFVTDLLICVLNIYCILCVISQYQEYISGRGRAISTNEEGTGSRSYNRCLKGSRVNIVLPKVTIKISENITKTSCQILPSSSVTDPRSQQSWELTSISEERKSDHLRLSIDDMSCEETTGCFSPQVSTKSFPISECSIHMSSGNQKRGYNKITSVSINRSTSFTGKTSGILSSLQDFSEVEPLINSALGENSILSCSTVASRTSHADEERRQHKLEKYTFPSRSYTCPVGFNNVVDKKEQLSFRKISEDQKRSRKYSNFTTAL